MVKTLDKIIQRLCCEKKLFFLSFSYPFTKLPLSVTKTTKNDRMFSRSSYFLIAKFNDLFAIPNELNLLLYSIYLAGYSLTEKLSYSDIPITIPPLFCLFLFGLILRLRIWHSQGFILGP